MIVRRFCAICKSINKRDFMPIYTPNDEAILQARLHLNEGDLVAFPTETVYGLGADAYQPQAVEKIFHLKKRPDHNPLILHAFSLEQVEKDIVLPAQTHEFWKLANAFWPGPLTLVVEQSPSCALAKNSFGGGNTVALRLPSHAVARALLKLGPLVAPSANRSGCLSPSRAHHVAHSLGSQLYILDDGPCVFGLESTVLDARSQPFTCLRLGAIALESIANILGYEVYMKGDKKLKSTLSPGLLEAHYAPQLPVMVNQCYPVSKDWAYVHFGPQAPNHPYIENLSVTASLEEAAFNLFNMLYILDQTPCLAIAVAPIPMHGLGLAINDRLNRAAAAGIKDPTRSL
jgi:L-threonylcarbamoyladenylate synthase